MNTLNEYENTLCVSYSILENTFYLLYITVVFQGYILF